LICHSERSEESRRLLLVGRVCKYFFLHTRFGTPVAACAAIRQAAHPTDWDSLHKLEFEDMIHNDKKVFNVLEDI
jgi:hypothetical protein